MKNVPSLRFKEFSGEWESKKAENIFCSITDKKHDGNLLVLSATQDRGVIPRSETGIDIKYEKENLSSYKKVKYNDYIISLRSFQGGIEHSKYEGLVSPAYTVFNFKDNSSFNHNFFATIFKSQNFINRLNTLTYGIRDGKAISFTDFSSMKLTYPEKKEQEKIASFFSLIDKKIELQTEKVEELKNYKKGIIQKIFSQELRFKGFYDKWEITNLRQATTGFDYGMNSAATEFDGENKYIRITDIDENTNKYINTNIVSPLGDLEEKYLVRENDILFTRTGASTGKTYLYDDKDGKLYFAGFLIRASINSNYSSKFIFLQTQTIEYKKWVQIMSMRSGQPGINSQEYASYSFYAPSIEEQEKIASCLFLIDKKIELQIEKLNQLQLQKKGLLQQMFI